MKKILPLLLLSSITACAPPLQRVETHAQFNAEQAKQLLSVGTNTINGSALIRQMNGGVVTCAGVAVRLTPATDYATERQLAIYQSTRRGFNSIYGRKFEFANIPREYDQLVRTTTCDAQGFFKFEKVADGTFYVSTMIVWKVSNYESAGGAIMNQVSVKDGEVKEIVLTP